MVLLNHMQLNLKTTACPILSMHPTRKLEPYKRGKRKWGDKSGKNEKAKTDALFIGY